MVSDENMEWNEKFGVQWKICCWPRKLSKNTNTDSITCWFGVLIGKYDLAGWKLGIWPSNYNQKVDNLEKKLSTSRYNLCQFLLIFYIKSFFFTLTFVSPQTGLFLLRKSLFTLTIVRGAIKTEHNNGVMQEHKILLFNLLANLEKTNDRNFLRI